MHQADVRRATQREVEQIFVCEERGRSHCGKYVERGPLHGIVHRRQIDQGFQRAAGQVPLELLVFLGELLLRRVDRPFDAHPAQIREADFDGTVAATRRGADFDVQACDLGMIGCVFCALGKRGQPPVGIRGFTGQELALSAMQFNAEGQRIRMLPTRFIKQRGSRGKIALRRGIGRRRDRAPDATKFIPAVLALRGWDSATP
jgi:hypothetical protein